MGRIDILLCGVGGQGTVLASKILARCAVSRAEAAHTAETIGMAQRGGCVTSHVRIGDSHAPLIPIGGADAIIAFEPAEAVRAIAYLKPDGVIVANTCAIKPVTDTLASSGYSAGVMLDYLKKLPQRVVFIDGDAIARDCGSPRVVNMALLGAAAATGAIGTRIDELERVIATLAPKYREANLKALHMGAQAAM